MLRRTPLKRGKPLNRMSAKKIASINAEYDTRIQLVERCGGTPMTTTRTICLNNGDKHDLTTVTCIGGICEVCGKPAGPQHLHPHEKLPRSLGGKLTLENSVMCHDHPCHALEQVNTAKRSRK